MASIRDPDFSDLLVSSDDRLDEVLDRDAPSDALWSAAIDISNRLSQSALLPQYLFASAASKTFLDACSRTSVRHPLGFDKFVLGAFRNYDLRLHVWWPKSGPPLEDIHDHRFDFASTVLVGELHLYSYQTGSRDGEALARYSEERSRDGKRYVFRRRGQTRVDLQSTSVLSPGSCYYMRAETLHRVACTTHNVVATLFIKCKPRRTRTTVLVDLRDKRKPLQLLRESLTPSDIRSAFLHVAETLWRPHSGV